MQASERNKILEDVKNAFGSIDNFIRLKITHKTKGNIATTKTYFIRDPILKPCEKLLIDIILHLKNNLAISLDYEKLGTSYSKTTFQPV